MSTPRGTSTTIAQDPRSDTAHDEQSSVQRSETKSAFKTTEFVVYLVTVVAVLIASDAVDDTPRARRPVLG